MAGQDDIAARLKGLKKADLVKVAADLNMGSQASKASAANLRSMIEKSLVEAARFGGKNSVASQSSPWSSSGGKAIDSTKVDRAAMKTKEAQLARINAALDKVAAAPAAPKAKAAKAPSPARQKALTAYREAFSHEPPKSMSIKDLKGDAEAHWRHLAQIHNRGNRGMARDPALDATRPHYSAEGMRQSVLAKRAAEVRPQPDLTRMASHAQTTTTALTTTPPPQMPGTGQRIMQAYAKASPALAMYSVGVQAAGAYQRALADGADHGRAAIEAVKASAVPAAIMAAKPIEYGAGKLAAGAFGVAGELAGSFGAPHLMPLTGAVAGVGVAAKGLQIAAKVAGRVALPAVVGYSAYQGAQEDKNTIRGAVRGAIRGLDPTSIFMARGLGERVYDAAFGQAESPRSFWDVTPKPPFGETFKKEMNKLGDRFRSGDASGGRLTPAQEQQFARADSAYRSRNAAAVKAEKPKKGESKGRGFANPSVQMAAQQGRGVQNITAWAESGQAFPGAKG